MRFCKRKEALPGAWQHASHSESRTRFCKRQENRHSARFPRRSASAACIWRINLLRLHIFEEVIVSHVREHLLIHVVRSLHQHMVCQLPLFWKGHAMDHRRQSISFRDLPSGLSPYLVQPIRTLSASNASRLEESLLYVHATMKEPGPSAVRRHVPEGLQDGHHRDKVQSLAPSLGHVDLQEDLSSVCSTEVSQDVVI